MIETLDKLTVSQFTDLLCGDTSVLVSRHEIVSHVKLAIAMRNIIFQYREIADIKGVKSYLSGIEELIKARLSSTVLIMCSNMLALNEFDKAREVLEEFGINASTLSEKRLVAEVESKIERVKYEIEKIEKENEKDNQKNIDIRKEFDAQTAALMAYFKFQIDTSAMKATLYAHLIDRFNKEIKAQKAQIDSMKNR